MKPKEFGKFRLVTEKFAESSRGMGNPLELLIGHLLVPERHHWLLLSTKDCYYYLYLPIVNI